MHWVISNHLVGWDEFLGSKYPTDLDLTKDWDSPEFLGAALLRQSIAGKEIENDYIYFYISQMICVNIWTTTKRSLNDILRIKMLEGTQQHNKLANLYRWKNMKKNFMAEGVDLCQCASYDEIDECRELNNSIKHSGTVGERLAQYMYFFNHFDSQIDFIEIDLQRYLNGMYTFISSVIESVAYNLHSRGVFMDQLFVSFYDRKHNIR